MPDQVGMPELIPSFDLYAELEVSEAASPETIEAAWRSLARRNHPDVAGSPDLAAAKMARLNVAHDWLTDRDLRRRYDESRSRRATPQPRSPERQADPARGPDPGRPKAQPVRPRPEPRRSAPAGGRWAYPDLSILDPIAGGTGFDSSAIASIERVLVYKLRSLGVEAHVRERRSTTVGLLLGLELGAGVRLHQFERLQDDLAMALANPGVRILAPMAGTHLVGVEVPAGSGSIVQLRHVAANTGFAGSSARLMFALGVGQRGEVLASSLDRNAHVLIAGTTGSGKSVALTALLASLVYRASPGEVRLIIIDPRGLEFAGFVGLPHLLAPIISSKVQAAQALAWAARECGVRLRRISEASARDLQGLNEKSVSASRLPAIVIAIDEIADIVMEPNGPSQEHLDTILRDGRAAGMHLVLTTYRPGAPILDGMTKANLVGRVGLAMTSSADSRLLFDVADATQLRSPGELLFRAPGSTHPIRLQGVAVSDGELERIVRHWQHQAPDWSPEPAIVDTADEVRRPSSSGQATDRLLFDAIAVAREYDRVSASLLQRRLKIGNARANALIDLLEAAGVIAPVDGSGARRVLDNEASEPDTAVPSSEPRTPEPVPARPAATPAGAPLNADSAAATEHGKSFLARHWAVMVLLTIVGLALLSVVQRG